MVGDSAAPNVWYYGELSQAAFTAWTVNPRTFSNSVNPVKALAAGFTAQTVVGVGDYGSLFSGTNSEDTAAFTVGSGTIGTNIVLSLNTVLKAFYADTEGNLFSTTDPLGAGFTYITTFPLPVTSLLGVPVGDTTYPTDDQEGIWALSQQDENGQAHLYRHSFTSGTLIDIPFPPGAQLVMGIMADSSISAELDFQLLASVTADSSVSAELELLSQVGMSADSAVTASLSNSSGFQPSSDITTDSIVNADLSESTSVIEVVASLVTQSGLQLNTIQLDHAITATGITGKSTLTANLGTYTKGHQDYPTTEPRQATPLEPRHKYTIRKP